VGDCALDSGAGGRGDAAPGYAIEYDSVDATELDRTLRVKSMEGSTWPGRSTDKRL